MRRIFADLNLTWSNPCLSVASASVLAYSHFLKQAIHLSATSKRTVVNVAELGPTIIENIPGSTTRLIFRS